MGQQKISWRSGANPGIRELASGKKNCKLRSSSRSMEADFNSIRWSSCILLDKKNCED